MVTISTTVGDVTLDAALSFSETLSATVTDHPIETGGFVTDHTIELPMCIKVDGIFTEDPIDREHEPAGPTSNIDLLREAKKTREPCTISNDTDSYQNMVLETLEIPRDGQTGAAVKFTATFKEVRFVASRTVAVQKSRKPARQSKGKQATQEADRATQTRAKTGLRAITKKVTASRGPLVEKLP